MGTRKLQRYAKTWHRPVKPPKRRWLSTTHHSMSRIGHHIRRGREDNTEEALQISRLPTMVDSQLIKLRKTYSTAKKIDEHVPMSVRVTNKFFNPYMWPHLSSSRELTFSSNNGTRLSINLIQKMHETHPLPLLVICIITSISPPSKAGSREAYERV
jgi:hypothetical protein